MQSVVPPPPFENPRHVSSVSVGIHFSYSLSQEVCKLSEVKAKLNLSYFK